MMERVAGVPGGLPLFLPDNNGLGSEAFNLDLQLGYLRHFSLLWLWRPRQGSNLHKVGLEPTA